MLYDTQNPHGGESYLDPGIRLDLSANINPLGPPRFIRKALIRFARADALSRYPDPRCRDMLAAISHIESVPEEYILCGAGAAELIFAFCAAARPKKALELAPCFLEYSKALERTGCEVERFLLTREDDFILKEEFLNHVFSVNPDVIFITNPNNPTGRLVPTEILNELLNICHKKHIRLVLDECFLNISRAGSAASMTSRLDDFPELIILKSFTKAFSVPSVRTGYCMCSDRALLKEMSEQTQTWNVSGAAQIVACAADSWRSKRYIERSAAYFDREHEYLYNELNKLGFYVCPSDANFILFYSKTPLIAALRAHGIALRDCSNYIGLGEGWYRSAILSHRDNRCFVNALRECGRGETPARSVGVDGN